jgi:hypothetical protein
LALDHLAFRVYTQEPTRLNCPLVPLIRRIRAKKGGWCLVLYVLR